jgi:hypothetical protein
MIWLAFGLGIGDFSSRRKKMKDYVDETNRRLSLLRTPTRVIDWHHSTGNFIVQTPKTNRFEISEELSLALGTSCAVLTINEVEHCLSVSDKAASPQAQPEIRWTKGIAFEVRGRPIATNPPSNPRAVFFQINNRALGVFKRDQVTDSDVLDKEDRRGGWGAISEDIAKAVGGKWTARSQARVQGLIEKARTHLS